MCGGLKQSDLFWGRRNTSTGVYVARNLSLLNVVASTATNNRRPRCGNNPLRTLGGTNELRKEMPNNVVCLDAVERWL